MRTTLISLDSAASVKVAQRAAHLSSHAFQHLLGMTSERRDEV